MNYPKSFTDLVECFKRLPGIGGKSAERLAYHVLSMDKEYVQEFANVLSHFQDNIHYCKKCGHICEGELCEICKDAPRPRHGDFRSGQPDGTGFAGDHHENEHLSCDHSCDKRYRAHQSVPSDFSVTSDLL